MEMLRSNLDVALIVAIEAQREYERRQGKPGRDSGFLQGLLQVKAALDRGEHVEIVEETTTVRRARAAARRAEATR